MEPLSDDLIARFRADYERLLLKTDGPGHLIALAVSGGPDSMGMLGLATAAFPGRVIAATVDHALRRESADEARMVAKACERLGIRHALFRIGTSPDASANLHAWARRERYRLLLDWAAGAKASTLCTAHHAEDQAETFLMRAARASGLRGLAAVRARRELEVAAGSPAKGVSLLRPLLRWYRRELRSVAETLRLPTIDDPSNRDPRFDRTRFRAWLAEAPWIDPVQIGRTAENLAALDEDVGQISAWLWQARARESAHEEVHFDVDGLPRGVTRYLARMAIDHVLAANGMNAGNWNPASNVESLLDALEAGSSATQAEVLASAKGTVWYFRKAPPRRSLS